MKIVISGDEDGSYSGKVPKIVRDMIACLEAIKSKEVDGEEEWGLLKTGSLALKLNRGPDYMSHFVAHPALKDYRAKLHNGSWVWGPKEAIALYNEEGV